MKHIGVILGAIAGLLVFFLCLLLFLTGGIVIGEKEVDCYDHHNNKIIGAKCVIESDFSTIEEAETTCFLIGITGFIFLTSLGLLLDYLIEKNEHKRW